MENTNNKSEMLRNHLVRVAQKNIHHAANEYIGGLENTLYDYAETDEEYINAKGSLADHDLLVDMIYDMSVSGTFDDGYSGPANNYTKAIKFLGTKQLRALVEQEVTKQGY